MSPKDTQRLVSVEWAYAIPAYLLTRSTPGDVLVRLVGHHALAVEAHEPGHVHVVGAGREHGGIVRRDADREAAVSRDPDRTHRKHRYLGSLFLAFTTQGRGKAIFQRANQPTLFQSNVFKI